MQSMRKPHESIGKTWERGWNSIRKATGKHSVSTRNASKTHRKIIGNANEKHKKSTRKHKKSSGKA